MSLLLYSGNPPSSSAVGAYRAALDAARTGTLESWIFILPTGRAAGLLERTLATEHAKRTGQPLERAHILTFEGFVSTFHAGLRRDRRPLTPGIHLLLVEQAMREVDLDYFGHGGADPSLGVVERVASIIAGVRNDGVTPENFLEDIEEARRHADPKAEGYDIPKLQDLYNIYSNYRRLLGETWIDHAGRLGSLRTMLEENPVETFRRVFPTTQTLIIDGLTEITRPQAQFLELMRRVDHLDLLVVFDYERGNGPLYGNFDEAIGRLRRAGFQERQQNPHSTDGGEERRGPFDYHVRRNLFRTRNPIRNGEHDNRITAFEFHNREEEAQGIAALVKSLAAEQGVPLETMAVVVPRTDDYAPLLREAFAAAGMPATTSAGWTLDHNGLVTAIVSALAIPSGDFDTRDLLRAVASPYLSFGGRVDAVALASAAARLRIRRGHTTWLRRIEGRLTIIEGRMRGSGLEEEDVETLREEQTILLRARESIRTLAEAVLHFDRRMTPEEFRTLALRLTAQLGAPEQVLCLRYALEEQGPSGADWQRLHDEIERDTRALAALTRLLEDLTAYFASQEAQTPRRGDGRHDLAFYLDHLRTACARTPYSLRERHDQGILIAAPESVQGLKFEVVIVCGLVDGEFPAAYQTERLLGKPLEESERRHESREKIRFSTSIAAGTEQLYLTWPRNVGRHPVVRSRFVADLLRITTLEEQGRVVEIEELRALRDRYRTEGVLPPHAKFLARTVTFDQLAEEVGAALWSGAELPRIAEADTLVAHLRHTVGVEQARRSAIEMADDSVARAWRGLFDLELDEKERAVLAATREMPFSPSQLELYARCPFKYFARRVMGIRPPHDYDISLTPLEQGLLLHSVLYRLYTDLRAENGLPISIISRAEVLERARGIASEQIAGIVLEHPYWTLDQERLLGSTELNGMLEEWIDKEIERGAQLGSMLQPSFFEVSIGTPSSLHGGVDGTLSTNEPVKLHGLSLRGRIDRVEIDQRDDGVRYTVADYKTGTPPGRADIVSGLSMQLPLYLAAVRGLLVRYFDRIESEVLPVGGIYYRLNARRIESKLHTAIIPNAYRKEYFGAERNVPGYPSTPEELDELIESVVATAAQHVEDIAAGRFNVTERPIEQVCRSCEFASVCRVRELQMPKRRE